MSVTEWFVTFENIRFIGALLLGRKIRRWAAERFRDVSELLAPEDDLAAYI